MQHGCLLERCLVVWPLVECLPQGLNGNREDIDVVVVLLGPHDEVVSKSLFPLEEVRLQRI